MSAAIFAGGCLCGAIRYEARGAPEWVNHCHCVQCQRATGAALSTWAAQRIGDLHFVQGQGTPKEFASSPGVRRGFCPDCGSTLTWCADHAPAWIDIAAGTLDDADALVPREHLFTKSRRPWLPLCDGLPAYAERRPKR